MNNIEFKKLVDKQLADFIMRTLLIEIGKKINLASHENSYVKNLCHFLGISKDRLSTLQKLVIENEIEIFDETDSFNFDSFFLQIHEQVKTSLFLPYNLQLENPLFYALKI